MLSKTKLVASVAGLFLVASGWVGAVSASASGPDPVVCTVSGSVTSSGIGLTAKAGAFSFTSVSIVCTDGPVGSDDAGVWTVSASGTTANETCAAAVIDSGTITGGTSPHDGAVNGGTFSGNRVGTAVVVTGTITTAGSSSPGDDPNPETHNFTASLTFSPTNGICDPQSGQTTDTTTADIIAPSVAAVTE